MMTANDGRTAQGNALPKISDNVAGALAELFKSRACLVGGDAATLAANPDDLAWWLTGLLEHTQAAIGLLEQALKHDEGARQ